MQRSPSKITLRIHIRTVCDQQFGDFLVTFPSRMMQRSHTITIRRIHISTFIQYRLDSCKVAAIGSIVNRISEGGCGQ